MTTSRTLSLSAWILFAAGAPAQVTQMLSIGPTGEPGSDRCMWPSLSADARFAVFGSRASNLVPNDANGTFDVFVRDRQLGTTERVSVAQDGTEGNGQSSICAISADGRFVAFSGSSSNLVPGDTNGSADVFVHDRRTRTIERVSLNSLGREADSHCTWVAISADGRFVAFTSVATNLVPGDTNGNEDVFVRDRVAGTTERVSVSAGGVEGDGDSGTDYGVSMSADGRFVAFSSAATNLVWGDTNGEFDVFVRDRALGTTERVSVASKGKQGEGLSAWASISADGRYVAFSSGAANLAEGDTNGAEDVFVRDRRLDATKLVSRGSSGILGADHSGLPSLSQDGRHVAFRSSASNLVPRDTNGVTDVFVRDLDEGVTERVTLATDGTQTDDDSGAWGLSISADGRYAVFESDGMALWDGRGFALRQVYVRDRLASGFASTCELGANGVATCPCTNAPSGLGRGCDNSAGTGGAVLSASGVAYLTFDSLVLQVRGATSNALSIFLQGDADVASGVVFGQGIGCLGGTMIRMYEKVAADGAVLAPDFGAGDPSVSARSAARGDVLRAGQSRWYLVAYRDSVVLGGCAPTSTFNATQTGRVAWSL